LIDKIDEQKIRDRLSKILEPELGLSITDLNILTKIEVDDESVYIEFHMASPYTPSIIAVKLVKKIKDSIYELEGVKSVVISLRNHWMADFINRAVNKMP